MGISPSRGLRFQPFALAAMGFVWAAVAGCAPQTAEVNVPIASWPGYEYFYLAERRGLAERYGLKLTISQFTDPQEIVHSYLRGELNLAQLTTVELVDICEKIPERCPVVVLILDESRGGDIIAARHGVDSLQDLAGKRIGSTFSSLGPYFVSRALQRSGLSLDQVELRNMPMAEMPAALEQGSVDAVAFYPPFSDYAARDGHSRVLFDSRQTPGEIFDILVVDPSYLHSHSVVLTKLVKAWQDAHQLAQTHPKQATGLMADRQKVTAKEFQQAERGLVYYGLADQIAMLAPGGVMERNLKSVQKVQQELELVRIGAQLPSVTNLLVEAALR
jgi:NitT/TauT family transport system substrate-binding protein